MDWMLEKKERQKIELLTYLKRQIQGEISVKEIGEALSWSKYLVLTMASELVADLTSIYGEEQTADKSLQLSADEKKLLLSLKRHVNVDAVMLVYLRESLYWNFIKEVFLETVTSYEEFAERYLTTPSTTRNVKNHLVERLAPLGIGIDDHYHFTGDESAIRMFFFRLAVRYFGDREFPYGEQLKQQADEGIDRLVASFTAEPFIRDSKRIALRFYYALAAIRVREGHFVDPHNLDDIFVPTHDMAPTTQALLAEMVADSLQYDTINADQAAVEARETLYYLYILNVVGSTDWEHIISPKMQQRIQAIMTIVADYHQRYFGVGMTPASATQIRRELLAPVLMFELHAIDVGHRRYFDMEEAYRMYPVLVEMAINVSRDIAPLRDLTPEESERLMFGYLFTAFAAYLDQADIFAPIKIDIDITYRPALEVILKRMLAGMAEFNIVFTNRFEDNVDLVISDAMLAEVDSRNRFDWQQLPTIKQIAQLRSRLSVIKRQKFEARFKELNPEND